MTSTHLIFFFWSSGPATIQQNRGGGGAAAANADFIERDDEDVIEIVRTFLQNAINSN